MSFVSKLTPADATTHDVAIESHFDFRSEEYQSLHQRSQTTAFQGPWWLDALYGDVAPSLAEPLIVTARETGSGRLLLVLPLVRSRRSGVTFVEFADFGLCDYLRAIYDPVDAPLLIADTTLPGRIDALLPQCDVVSLTKLTIDDPILERLFPTGRRTRMRFSAYPVKVGNEWTAWRSGKFDRSFRRHLDTRRRRATRAGTPAFTFMEDASEITRAFDALRRFRAERFKQLGDYDVTADDAVFSFYRRVAVVGARKGVARTFCLYLSGEPVAVVFGLVHRRTFLLLLIGFDVVRHSRLSLGLLALEDTMRASIEAGDVIFDFTIGDHPYKLQFGAEQIPVYQWQAARTVRGHFAVFGIHVLHETKRVLKPLVKRAIRLTSTTLAASKR